MPSAIVVTVARVGSAPVQAFHISPRALLRPQVPFSFVSSVSIAVHIVEVTNRFGPCLMVFLEQARQGSSIASKPYDFRYGQTIWSVVVGHFSALHSEQKIF